MAFTGIAEDGTTVTYKDHKRYWYLFAYVTPLVYYAAFWAYFALGNNPLVTLIPITWLFVITPMFDLLIGEDPHNPPDAVMPDMMKDKFYRFSIYPHIALAFLTFAITIWFVATQSLPWWSYLALLISGGIGSGGVLTLTHELGHKSNKLDRLMAKIGNSLIGYGHFCIEHNRGHHVMVSTPKDPASARMGENIYRFACREISGTFVRGWFHERERLAKMGYGFWTWRNDVLQSYAVTIAIMAICVAAFGPLILLYIIPHHMLGWYTLTQANYVEHYGLLRETLPNGKYERTQPHHSWNTNHLFSNMQLFHLQRHSDITLTRFGLIKCCVISMIYRPCPSGIWDVTHSPSFRRFGIKSWTKRSCTGPGAILQRSISTPKPKRGSLANMGQTSWPLSKFIP